MKNAKVNNRIRAIIVVDVLITIAIVVFFTQRAIVSNRSVIESGQPQVGNETPTADATPAKPQSYYLSYTDGSSAKQKVDLTKAKVDGAVDLYTNPSPSSVYVSPTGRYVLFGIPGGGSDTPYLYSPATNTIHAIKLPENKGAYPFWSTDDHLLMDVSGGCVGLGGCRTPEAHYISISIETPWILKVK